MAELHSLLRRQLKRHFPDARVPPEFEPMLAAIDQAYKQFDNDRAMLERSLDLSSQELLQANSELRALVSAFPDHILRLDPRRHHPRHQGARRRSSRGDGCPATTFSRRSIAKARPPVRDALQRVAAEHAAINIELEANADGRHRDSTRRACCRSPTRRC